MKIKKKALFMFLSALLTATLLFGCGENKSGDTTAIQSDTASEETSNEEETSAETLPNEEEEKFDISKMEITTITGDKRHVNEWIYRLDANGIMIREARFKSDLGGDPVTIAHMTDLHFNYCNEEDFKEANPSVMSTYENRVWLKDGESVPNAAKCLELGSKADQMVITGDVLDYISNGAIELLQTQIWDKYPEALVTLGNHESIRVCQGTVEDTTTFESRIDILKKAWKHDIFYTSKIIEEKVMVIQMDNASDNSYPGRFWECQIEPLKNDLALAREKGYVVLLFYHIPIATNNPEQGVVNPIYGKDGGPAYFATWGTSHNADDASAAVYDIIVNNADVIKGTFCGHLHSDYYTEIIAKNPDGTSAVIPQYILRGTPYEHGHVLWITVK